VARAAGSPGTQSGRAAPDASFGAAGDGTGLETDGAGADGDGVEIGVDGVAADEGELDSGALLGVFDEVHADSASATARTVAERDRGRRGITAGL
jgi:hypothetical protein